MDSSSQAANKTLPSTKEVTGNDHHYVDRSYLIDDSSIGDRVVSEHQHPYDNNNNESSTSDRNSIKVQSFPVRLHYMLTEVTRDGSDHIVSWQPHGRCFLVHDNELFIKKILPTWFRQSKLASFQRQLNLYGFRRLTRASDKNAYYHEYFLRSKPFLAHRITRKKIKGEGARKPSSPNTEPNFYTMPYLPEIEGVKPRKKQQDEKERATNLDLGGSMDNVQDRIRALNRNIINDMGNPVLPQLMLLDSNIRAASANAVSSLLSLAQTAALPNINNEDRPYSAPPANLLPPVASASATLSSPIMQSPTRLAAAVTSPAMASLHLQPPVDSLSQLAAAATFDSLAASQLNNGNDKNMQLSAMLERHRLQQSMMINRHLRQEEQILQNQALLQQLRNGQDNASVAATLNPHHLLLLHQQQQQQQQQGQQQDGGEVGQILRNILR